MRRKLIIDGNAVYEIDDDCSRRKERQQGNSMGQQDMSEKTLADVIDGEETDRVSYRYRQGEREK